MMEQVEFGRPARTSWVCLHCGRAQSPGIVRWRDTPINLTAVRYGPLCAGCALGMTNEDVYRKANTEADARRAAQAARASR